MRKDDGGGAEKRRAPERGRVLNRFNRARSVAAAARAGRAGGGLAGGGRALALGGAVATGNFLLARFFGVGLFGGAV